MATHTIKTNLKGLKKWAWRKNLNGFFSVCGKELSDAQVRKMVEWALKLYKEKGVAEVDITVKVGRDNEYYSTQRFNCLAFVWYKDNKFYIQEKLRDRLGKLIEKQVIREVSDKYGKPVDLMNKYSKKIHDLQIAKFILWTIALSGWAAFAGCLCKILN